MTINCIFCSAFSIWSPVLAKKKATERWNLLSGVHAVKPLLKTIICGDAWCIAEDSKVDGWKQIVIYVNCGFQDHTHSQIPSCEHQGHTQWRMQTHILHHAHSFYVYLLFLTLSLVFFCLHLPSDYYSIKPVIGLDSFYSLPVEYGSL